MGVQPVVDLLYRRRHQLPKQVGLGSAIGSVDLLFGDGCYYVGEANSIPGYSNRQQYEGEDVSERYKRLIMQFMAKTLNIKQ